MMDRTTFVVPVVTGALLLALLLPSGAAGQNGGTGPLPPSVMGNRFLTINTVVRVNQIEVTRDRNAGEDESALHTVDNARQFREAIAAGWPEARITWAFSWRALFSEADNYVQIRAYAKQCHETYRDDVTFIPGGYFYRFVQRGTGIGGSDKDKEIRWYMNKDFRLALLTDLTTGTEEVIDFTRYDVRAMEPADMTRRWSLMGVLNQKQTRPQDKPVPFRSLAEEDRRAIGRRYPQCR